MGAHVTVIDQRSDALAENLGSLPGYRHDDVDQAQYRKSNRLC